MSSMKITQFTFSRWGESDVDFSGLKLQNEAGQVSEVLGKEKYAFETVGIRNEQIKGITIFKKNEEYMRGFKIEYTSGEPTIVGSADGISVGKVNF